MTWDAAMSLREDIIDVLGDTCCFVIAALLFPDMEPDPAIVAEAKRSNVHVLWGTDNLMNRLAAIAARKAYYPPNADDIRREVAAVTDGQVLYAEEGPDQRHGEEGLFLPEQPEGPAAPRLEIPAAGITIGHVDTLIVHTAPGAVTDVVKGRGARELDQAPEPHETHGRSSSRTMTARLRTHPGSRGVGRNNFNESSKPRTLRRKRHDPPRMIGGRRWPAWPSVRTSWSASRGRPPRESMP